MKTVNMFDAKTNLSKLVEAIESGRETEVTLARNGRPAARLTALNQTRPGKRIGVAKGKFHLPASIDADNAQVGRLFAGEAG